MQDKKTLITIIVLFILCLSFGIYGTYLHFSGNSGIKADNNPNKELIYKGNVYFYDNDELIGTYPCSNCSAPKTIIDDDLYGINYYKDGTKSLATVYGNTIGLITENNKIDLLAIKTKKVTTTFDAIKTYNINHSKDIFLIKKDNKYAIYSVDSYILPMTEFIYDFLAIPNRVNDDVLDTSKIIAKDGESWFVLEYSSKDNKYVPSNVVYNPIVDLNDLYFVTLKDSKYELFDYSGKKQLESIMNNASKVIFANNYIGIVLNDNLLVYKDINNGLVKSYKLPSNYNKIELTTTNDELVVLIDDLRLDNN